MKARCLVSFCFVILSLIKINAQNLVEEDMLGTWTVDITDESDEMVKVMFGKLQLDFLDAHLVAVKLGSRVDSSQWRIKDDIVIIENEFMENPHLSGCVEGRCEWVFLKKRGLTITLSKGDSLEATPFEYEYQPLFVQEDQIVGDWLFTHLRDPSVSESINNMMIGNSEQNLDFRLFKDRTLYGEGFLKDTIYEGSWEIDGELLKLKYSDTYTYEGHIITATEDSLVIIDTKLRKGMMGDETKFMWIYTKSIGSGLMQYIFDADSLVDFSNYNYPFSFEVPSEISIDVDSLVKRKHDLEPYRLKFSSDHSFHDMYGSSIYYQDKSDNVTAEKRLASKRDRWSRSIDKFPDIFIGYLVDEDDFVIAEHRLINFEGTFEFVHSFEIGAYLFTIEAEFRYKDNALEFYHALKNKIIH